MGRKKKQPELKNKTKFIFKGLAPRSFKLDMKLEFKATKKHPLYSKIKNKPQFPTFNKDFNHFTPTFRLKEADEVSNSKYKELHHKKVEQSLLEFEEEEIMLAKPRSKHKYCAVCKMSYEDYRQHTLSEKHQESLKKSSFHKFIGNLCQQYQRKFPDVETFEVEKSASIETKLAEEENSTEPIPESSASKDVQAPQVKV